MAQVSEAEFIDGYHAFCRQSPVKIHSFRLSDVVQVDGRTGTVSSDLRPGHNYITVIWSDTKTESEVICADQVKKVVKLELAMPEVEVRILGCSGQRVLIAGATGNNAAHVNGAYTPTGQVHNGRELLQKEGDQDKWLRYATNNKWMVSPTSSKDENSCAAWMYSEVGVADPALASKWTVWDGSVWKDQGSVAVHTPISKWNCNKFVAN